MPFSAPSWGNLLTLVAMCGAVVVAYGDNRGEITAQKSDIQNIKNDQAKKEVADREVRKEMRDEIKEVKQDVKDVKADVQKILIELQRRR